MDEEINVRRISAMIREGKMDVGGVPKMARLSEINTWERDGKLEDA